MQKDVELLSNKDTHPNIVVGTPGRLEALVREKRLRLGNLKMFVLDECDKMLDQIGMRIPTRATSKMIDPWHRYATSGARNLPCYAYSKAGHDVQCNAVSRDDTYLQEVHEECT